MDPLIWTFVVSAMSGVCLSEFSMSFAATMWNIWLECNNIIFNNIASNFISRFFRTKELVMLCIGMTTLEGEDLCHLLTYACGPAQVTRSSSFVDADAIMTEEKVTQISEIKSA